MCFKRKIELRCVFDSVKKLSMDVLRQNITKDGGPEARKYLLDLCAPLSSWVGPVKNKTKPGQSTTQLKLARPEKTIYLLDPSYQYVIAEFSRLLTTLKTSWVSPSQTPTLFFHRDNKCMHLLAYGHGPPGSVRLGSVWTAVLWFHGRISCKSDGFQ